MRCLLLDLLGRYRYKTSDESMPHGIAGGVAAGIDTELAVDRLDMRFDCVRTQDELDSDLAGT